jgi:hypothetical protein
VIDTPYPLLVQLARLDLSDVERRVLSAMFRDLGDGIRCRCGAGTIAKAAGVEEATARACLRRLVLAEAIVEQVDALPTGHAVVVYGLRGVPDTMALGPVPEASGPARAKRRRG